MGNDQVEVEALSESLFNLLRGQEKRPIMLADWTDRHHFKERGFALSKDGRAVPFLCFTIQKGDFEGLASQTVFNDASISRAFWDGKRVLTTPRFPSTLVQHRSARHAIGIKGTRIGECNFTNSTWLIVNSLSE